MHLLLSLCIYAPPFLKYSYNSEVPAPRIILYLCHKTKIFSLLSFHTVSKRKLAEVSVLYASQFQILSQLTCTKHGRYYSVVGQSNFVLYIHHNH
jgi:hypothetical protein